MSTIDKRIELLGQVEEVARSIKFVLHGYSYILGHEDFDGHFNEHVIFKFEESLNALQRVGNVLTDVVNELNMKLD